MYDHLVHFFRFWYHAPRKIWQPCWQADGLLQLILPILVFPCRLTGWSVTLSNVTIHWWSHSNLFTPVFATPPFALFSNSLSLSLSFYLFLSISISLHLYISISFCTLFPPLSFYLCISFSIFLCISFYIFLSKCLFFNLYIFLSISSFSLSFCIFFPPLQALSFASNSVSYCNAF
jgi:hypothetical protein